MAVDNNIKVVLREYIQSKGGTAALQEQVGQLSDADAIVLANNYVYGIVAQCQATISRLTALIPNPTLTIPANSA